MTLSRIAGLVGVALLVLIVNVLLSVLYMVVYGHLINPGHDEQFYHDHIQVAAPYCSIVAGIPLMFLAGWWVAGWKNIGRPIAAALTVWVSYAVIDLAIIMAAGATLDVLSLFSVSFATKLVACWLGARMRANRLSAASTA